MDRFEDVKLRVKEASDLAAVVGSYIPLKQKGREFTALCPFHQEKTPSFFVVPEGQFFKCFGCGKAGDVFTFVMEREGVTFREALEMLAQRAGIPTDGVFGQGSHGKGTHGNHEGGSVPALDVHGALAAVRDFFRAMLSSPGGAEHREYLEKRGLADAIDAFGIGAYPKQPGLLSRFAKEHDVPMAALEAAGLVRDGGHREPFLGRVMFPIEDERGRVVGFGGRVLGKADESTGPKYLNSPESPYFNKRRVLFGLRRAKQKNARRIVVMEGYTDAIASQMAGIDGAVATLGTALTPDHCRLLQRYATDGVVLLFDGDAAGFKAADRAFRELVTSDLKLEIALLEGGVDPADLATSAPDVPAQERASRQQKLRAIVDSGADALTVWFRLLRRDLDFTDPAQAMRAVAECVSVLAPVPEPARREILVARMAPHLGITAESLRRELEKARRPVRKTQASVVETADDLAASSSSGANPAFPSLEALSASPRGRAELDLLAGLVARPNRASEIDTQEFVDGRLHRLLAGIQDGVLRGLVDRPSVISHLMSSCDQDPGLMSLVTHLAERAGKIKNPDEFIASVRAGVRTRAAREEAQRLRLRIQQAKDKGDLALADELLARYLDLLRASHQVGADSTAFRP